MVTDLIQKLANQMIRERISRYGIGNLDHSITAMLMAAGTNLIKTISLETKSETISFNNLTWTRCVAYGIHPVKLRRSGVVLMNPYKTDDDYGLSDPLHIAAFYAAYNKSEAAQLVLEEREELIRSYTRWYAQKMPPYFTDPVLGRIDWGKWSGDRNLTRTWVIPDFEDLGLARVPIHPTLDSFYLEGAFESTSYTEHLKRRIGPQNIEAVAMIAGLKEKPLHQAVQAAAFEQAWKLCTSDKKGGFRYSNMATYVRLCDPSKVSVLFDHLRGSRQVVALFRSDTSETHYIMGLRRLAQQQTPESRKEILERLGRAPTINEIRAIRTIGLINVLDEMDWALLEPLVNMPGLRAAALPYAEKLGPVVLRRFLTDHPARVKRLPSIENEAIKAAKNLRITDQSSIADWSVVMDRLRRMNAESVRIREALRDVTESDAVSFLALLRPHKASSPDIDDVLRSHPRWKQIETILEHYVPPDLSTLWK